MTHISKASFKSSWWLPGGHGQTMWPTLARKVRLQSRMERLDLPDGDFTRLDWVDGDGPIVVVLPGLQGNIGSPYARGLLRQCQLRGWRGVLLNYRGVGAPNRLARSYHCGMTCDLQYLIQMLRQCEPETPIAIVGFSVGANICLKWLGDSGRRGDVLPIAAAVAVSAPFHLGVVAKRIERGLSRIYQWRLLRSLRHDLVRKMQEIDMGLTLNRRDLRRLKTFFSFDNCVSAPLNGFKNAEDYYANTRTDEVLAHVAVPTLLLNAQNDPLVPANLIPHQSNISHKVTLEITRSGGHMGYVSGRWPWRPRFWLDQRIPDYLALFFNATPTDTSG